MKSIKLFKSCVTLRYKTEQPTDLSTIYKGCIFFIICSFYYSAKVGMVVLFSTGF